MTIVGQVWTYGDDNRSVVLRLQGDTIDWSEFHEATATGALARLADARQGKPVYYTHKTIPLVRVRRVEVDPPDASSEPRRVGTLKIVTGGLFGDYEVVCAFDDDCPWEAFLAFQRRVEEGARAAQTTQQEPQTKRTLANPLRRLANTLLATKTVCPRCSAEVQAGWTHCQRCGQELTAQPAATCAQCGKDVPSASAFCPHCGARQG
ncbi:MAG: double zinc ribbon domain-containing protein [Anaerolineae bacterium]